MSVKTFLATVEKTHMTTRTQQVHGDPLSTPYNLHLCFVGKWSQLEAPGPCTGAVYRQTPGSIHPKSL